MVLQPNEGLVGDRLAEHRLGQHVERDHVSCPHNRCSEHPTLQGAAQLEFAPIGSMNTKPSEGPDPHAPMLRRGTFCGEL